MNQYYSLLTLAFFTISSTTALANNIDLKPGQVDAKLNDYAATYSELVKQMTIIEQQGARCTKPLDIMQVGPRVAAKSTEAKKALGKHIQNLSVATNGAKTKIAGLQKSFTAEGTTIGTGADVAFNTKIVKPVTTIVADAKRVVAQERAEILTAKRELDQNHNTIRQGLYVPNNASCMAALKAYDNAFAAYERMPGKLDGISSALDGQVAIARSQSVVLARGSASVRTLASAPR